MDRREFSIAMHLIKKALQGFEIPPVLPPSLAVDHAVGAFAPPAMGTFREQFCTSCGAGTDGHLRNIADAWTRRRLRTCRVHFLSFCFLLLGWCCYSFLFIFHRVYFFDVPAMPCLPEFHSHNMFPNEFEHSLISIILYLFSGPAVGGFNSISMPAPPHTYSPQAKYAY